MNHIDKEIYKQADIARRPRPLPMWSIALCLLGVITTLLYLSLNNLSQGLITLLLICAVFGDLTLLTVICYLLFGDSRAPYYKKGKCFLDRELNYFAANAKEQLQAAIAAKNLAAVNEVKRNATPALAVITYATPDGTIAYCQLLKVQGDKEIPLSETTILQ